MEAREITPDIVVLRSEGERSVLVAGPCSAVAIDLPRLQESARQLAERAARTAPAGLRTAIVTREPEDADLPLEQLAPLAVVRADRRPELNTPWDVVPPELLRVRNVEVRLIREPRTLEVEGGRAFHVAPCTGIPRVLCVHIQPEDVLVVADDLQPFLPPAVQPGCVQEAVRRYEDWQRRAPRVLIPASGVPIAGEVIHDVLEHSIRYLKTLAERMRVQMIQQHYPWEMLVHTIHWSDHWPQERASRAIAERHRENIRAMASDIWLRLNVPDARVPA